MPDAERLTPMPGVGTPCYPGECRYLVILSSFRWWAAVDSNHLPPR